MRLPKVSLIVLSLAAAVAATGFTPAQPSWHLTPTGDTAHLRGLSAVDSRVAWASGYRVAGSTVTGVVLRTVDGGQSWRQVAPPDSAGLQFRDIEAFDADHAVLMAAGSGTDSRLYVTSDGGATWSETNRNTEPQAFYDCMTFPDRRHGLVVSDPVDGRFRILATEDGGSSWRVLPTAGMPDAQTDEFAFAASGECLTAAQQGGHDVWFGTGSAAQARVFHSTDYGLTWSVTATAVPSGPSAGIFALAFRNPEQGIAVGGDFAAPDAAPDAAAWSKDRGATWTTAARVPGGYRSGVAFVAHTPDTALAVGLTGSDISRDRGRTWTRFDSGSFDTVDCASDGACWASGDQGRVAVLRWG